MVVLKERLASPKHSRLVRAHRADLEQSCSGPDRLDKAVPYGPVLEDTDWPAALTEGKPARSSLVPIVGKTCCNSSAEPPNPSIIFSAASWAQSIYAQCSTPGYGCSLLPRQSYLIRASRSALRGVELMSTCKSTGNVCVSRKPHTLKNIRHGIHGGCFIKAA